MIKSGTILRSANCLKYVQFAQSQYTVTRESDMSSTADHNAQLGIVARVARSVLKHRARVMIAWPVILVVALGLSSGIGDKFSNNFSLPGTESQRAADLLKRDFPAQAGDSDQIVLASRQGVVTDAAIRSRATSMLAAVAKLPHVTGVISPYSATKGGAAISADGKVA